MPRIIKIDSRGSMAAQRAFVATVQYPDEKAKRITFVGPSTSGSSGPVVMISDKGHQTRVHDPSRFGIFGREWIRRFFA